MATFRELKSAARSGGLTRDEVGQLLADGQITEDQADELDQLITEHERHQQLVAAAAPAAMPLFPLRTIEIVAEEIRSNRITDGEAVDTAWAYAVGLREACGRWSRDDRKVTADLDPFALRVLRFIYNRRFEDLGVTEGVRILGRCSYVDLRRAAAQGAHEKRLRVLNGSFDRGLLNEAAVADATKKGLGIPVMMLDGEELTGLLAQHYRRRAFLVSSFEELESALTAPSGQGGLGLEAVQKAKESGKLLQVPSPEVWEQSREEQRLQDLLGPEYWYLNSATGPERGTFAVLVDRHRMVLEDGSRDPRPILQVLAERISGDGVVVTEDDLWPYFGGRPAAGAAPHARPQSVFFSERLAAHFAGRLDLPVEVVRELFTRHHDMAGEIMNRQGVGRKIWHTLFSYGAATTKFWGPDVVVHWLLVALAGAAAGFTTATLTRQSVAVWYVSGIAGLVAALLGVTLLRRVRLGGLPRMGIVFPMVASVVILLLSLVTCSAGGTTIGEGDGKVINDYLQQNYGSK